MWYESYSWYGVVGMKKKILNQYERLVRALNFDRFFAIFFTMLIIGLTFVGLGKAVTVSDNVIMFSIVGAACALLASITITNNIVKQRQMEWKCLDYKEQCMQSNHLSFNINNDEKEKTLDKLFNGEEILMDTPELNGKISVKLILEEKDEKDNL